MGDLPSTSDSLALNSRRLSTGLSEWVVRSENRELKPSTSKDLTRNFQAGPVSDAGFAPRGFHGCPFVSMACSQLSVPPASRPASRRPVFRAIRETVSTRVPRSQSPPSTVSFSVANNGSGARTLRMLTAFNSLDISCRLTLFPCSPASTFALKLRSMPAIAALSRDLAALIVQGKGDAFDLDGVNVHPERRSRRGRDWRSNNRRCGEMASSDQLRPRILKVAHQGEKVFACAALPVSRHGLSVAD